MYKKLRFFIYHLFKIKQKQKQTIVKQSDREEQYKLDIDGLNLMQSDFNINNFLKKCLNC